MIVEINNEFCEKMCAELMNGRFICYYKDKDADDYSKINMVENFTEIQKRLDLVGYILMHSETNKTFYVVSKEWIKHRKLKFNKLESTVLLFLIQEYFKGMRSINTGTIVYVKWNDFLKDIEDVFQNNAEKKKVIDALWIFKNAGIINTDQTKKDLAEEDKESRYVIKIYPSVNCILKYEKLQDVEERIAEYISKKEDNTNNDEKGDNE